VQTFTGTTTQTVLLPTTSVVVGQSWAVVNNSTGIVTVQSSGANTVATVSPGATQIFVAQVATPTTAAHWETVIGRYPAVTSTASNATPALDATKDATVLTAQAAAITAFSLSGTFVAEQKHMLRIKDSGTARAITWTSTVIVAADGITLPTTTVVGKTHKIGLIYDEVVGKLIAVAVTSY
jgi:hypothetical protein